MTVYIKYENGKMITAPNEPIENLIANGYEASTEEFVANYFYKQSLQSQIDTLELSQARAIREIALGKSVEFAMGKLQALDKQIAEIRTQIAGL